MEYASKRIVIGVALVGSLGAALMAGILLGFFSVDSSDRYPDTVYLLERDIHHAVWALGSFLSLGIIVIQLCRYQSLEKVTCIKTWIKILVGCGVANLVLAAFHLIFLLLDDDDDEEEDGGVVVQ